MLDKKKLKEIKKKLDEKIKNTKCESCGQDIWIFDAQLLIFLLTDDPDVFPGGNVAPSITMTCQNCGHIRFYNLVVLGIWDKIVKKKLK